MASVVGALSACQNRRKKRAAGFFLTPTGDRFFPLPPAATLRGEWGQRRSDCWF